MPSEREQINVRLAPGFGAAIEGLRAAIGRAMPSGRPVPATEVIHAAVICLCERWGVTPPLPAGETRGRKRRR